MSSGDKNISFRRIIWTKKIFFRQSDICPFLTKGEIVYKNPLKRSVLKSQFQNPRNLDEKDWFIHTIHTKTTYNSRGNKNRLNTLSYRLLGASLEVPTKYYVKTKMMWTVSVNYMIFFPIIPMKKHNHCVVWCPLHSLVMQYVAYLKTICASDTESRFLTSSVSFYYR